MMPLEDNLSAIDLSTRLLNWSAKQHGMIKSYQKENDCSYSKALLDTFIRSNLIE